MFYVIWFGPLAGTFFDNQTRPNIERKDRKKKTRKITEITVWRLMRCAANFQNELGKSLSLSLFLSKYVSMCPVCVCHKTCRYDIEL